MGQTAGRDSRHPRPGSNRGQTRRTGQRSAHPGRRRPGRLGHRHRDLVASYSPAPNHIIRPLRTLGYRRVGSKLMPLLHAKLMLLGELTWMEDEEFGLGDITRFQPSGRFSGNS
jgi:hypothetical protein